MTDQPDIDPVLANLRAENQTLLRKLGASGVGNIDLLNGVLIPTLLEAIFTPEQLRTFMIAYETRVGEVLARIESESTRAKLLQGVSTRVVPGPHGFGREVGG